MIAILTTHILLVLCVLIPISATGADNKERGDLGLVLEQLNSTERLADRARQTTEDSANTRYQFDYDQLHQDLRRIRGGINGYLSPSRAQPNDPTSLSGEYREDRSTSSSGHEHD